MPQHMLHIHVHVYPCMYRNTAPVVHTQSISTTHSFSYVCVCVCVWFLMRNHCYYVCVCMYNAHCMYSQCTNVHVMLQYIYIHVHVHTCIIILYVQMYMQCYNMCNVTCTYMYILLGHVGSGFERPEPHYHSSNISHMFRKLWFFDSFIHVCIWICTYIHVHWMLRHIQRYTYMYSTSFANGKKLFLWIKPLIKANICIVLYMCKW